MNKTKRPKTAAVIDIGSNMVKMRLSCLQKGSVCDLERLEYPVRLGHEVFSDQKISFESLRQLSEILRGYRQVMMEYSVTQYKVVATTALREAKNRAYITDQLKVHNDMAVDVLENDQEKTLIYSEILRRLQTTCPEVLKGALISYIGTGSIGASIYREGNMVFSQNIPMGSLKLHDMFGTLEKEGAAFADLLDEYLGSILSRVHFPHEEQPIQNLIITGSEMELVARLCGVPLTDGCYCIPANAFIMLYGEMRGVPAGRICEKFEIDEARVDPLYTALALYSHICTLVDVPLVVCPKVELWDAVARQLLVPGSPLAYEEHVRENAISCAFGMARHYGCDITHVKTILSYANLIFDRMKKIHGVSNKKRLILELACILHESGYFVNSKYHLRSTFDLIKNTDIYGLTDEEVLLVAYVARFTDFLAPNAEKGKLSEKNQVTVAKLVAIFRIANALDKSCGQKLKSVSARLSKDMLYVTAVSDKNTMLEQWAFEDSAVLFEEVFGIRPRLTVKSDLV